MTKFQHVLKWCLSPTLFFSERYKQKAIHQQDRGRRVRRLNKTYFGISIVMLLLLIAENGWLNYTGIKKVFLIIIPLWSLSRVNEIFMAFIKDVFDKLIPSKRQKNGLEYHERVSMAFRSFIELTIQYAILYFLLDTHYLEYRLTSGLFNQPLKSPFTALYLSLITIASVGYGDYVPVHPLARGLIMYEIITGFLLIAVCFTVYVSLDLDEKEAP
ncbi:potassium channel family protein [Niameybacter massiliensis]|uniref:Potassium channel family protein n=1 Tax=Holtiella tumoricola TaxID=3018743 RepID=A0AA42DPJ5_9FIRM|nr:MULTISPECIES: potassium channel family protein [Lachnospirales]MDA3732418.1 potassium channel family protein [Holtiella tumoricola]